MATMPAGDIVARVLLDEGVKFCFGIGGGHNFPHFEPFMWQGVKYVHFRHEQAGGYAAIAYGDLTRGPGVCTGTAGPGACNMVSCMQQAYLRKDPIVSLSGQHPTMEDGRASLQEAYPNEFFKSMTKWTARCTSWLNAAYLIKKAFRISMEYPPGPTNVDLPLDVFLGDQDDTMIMGWTPSWLKSRPPKTMGDPELVEQMVDMILQAERPILVCGEGIYWADASPELNELVDLLQIPVHTRRMGRGAVSEDHPLHVHGGFRGGVFREADLFVIVGLRMGYLEGYGAWAAGKKVIQINESERELESSIPTEVAVVGNPKLVFKQMIDIIKAKGKTAPIKEEWRATVRELREKDRIKNLGRVKTVWDRVPIHYDRLGNDIVEVLDPSSTIILDSFTASSYLTDKITARFAGQILDSGEHAGVGHGIGMGIGAQIARPGKPVFVLMGDGGMGNAAWDIETAVRHKQPVVYLVSNNSGWVSGLPAHHYGPYNEVLGGGEGEGFNEWYLKILPDCRYDLLSEVIPGLYGENVTKPEEIKPALERAFNSGKTAVINIVVDQHMQHQLHSVASVMVPMCGHVFRSPYADQMTEEGIKILQWCAEGKKFSIYEVFAERYGYGPELW